jgi:putative polyketide hydroxylase
MTRTYDTSVAVIGGGPIGLTTFVALRRAGVDAVLLEKHASTAFVPKALLLNERTMEIFRQLGLEDDVRGASLPRDDVGFAFHGASLTAPAYDRAPMVYRSDKTAVASSLCSQDALEPVLRDHAERLAPGQVLFGTEVSQIAQDAEGVELELIDRPSGARRALRARFAVAADGSRSSVREMLGIGTTGVTTLGHSAHVIFDAALGALVKDRASAMYYISGGLLFIIVDGDRRWRLMIDYDPESPDALNEERLIHTIRVGVGVEDLDVSIVGIFPWQPAALLADRFRDRRVLLAGDAAHVRPPWGGLGMNAGIGDAHNVTWKLAEVLAGRAGDRLLDTYERERRPIAQRTIDAAIANQGHVRSGVPPDAEARAAADRRRHAEGLVLGSTYESPAVIPDGTDPPSVDDDHADYVPIGRPGHRGPHFWTGHGGSAFSITDLFGGDFVLLSGPDGTAWRDAARRLAGEASVGLRAYVVGGRQGDVADPDGQWGELYGASADGAVLVRPDGYVAWRTSAAPADRRSALVNALATLLSRPIAG